MFRSRSIVQEAVQGVEAVAVQVQVDPMVDGGDPLRHPQTLGLLAVTRWVPRLGKAGAMMAPHPAVPTRSEQVGRMMDRNEVGEAHHRMI